MSEYSLAPELVESIKTFIDVLKSHPGILESPDLGFFREYLLSMGAKIPSKPQAATSDSGPTFAGSGDSTPKPKPKPAEPKFEDVELDEESEEPYPELDEEGVVEADELDPNQDMGNPDAAASEEDMDKSNELKMEAVSAYGEGNFEEAVTKYTEAIKLNGGSAIVFAKRGQTYLQLQKPKACIRDCNRALQINPDSAVAFKFRGRAHRLLGNWVESASDLRQACKIDFDEQADTWLKEVTPNARKLEEYRLRKKRRDDEREIKLRKRKAQDRARAHEEAKSSTPFAEEGGPGNEDFTGKVPGFDKIMNDPEVVELFSDPEVAAAFNDIGQNPMNILKYQSNPKVSKLLGILQKKMGGMGGFPGMGGMGGGMPGGMPFGGGGMPGGMPGGFGGFGGMPGFGSAGQAPPDSTSQGGAEDLD